MGEKIAARQMLVAYARAARRWTSAGDWLRDAERTEEGKLLGFIELEAIARCTFGMGGIVLLR